MERNNRKNWSFWLILSSEAELNTKTLQEVNILAVSSTFNFKISSPWQHGSLVMNANKCSLTLRGNNSNLRVSWQCYTTCYPRGSLFCHFIWYWVKQKCEQASHTFSHYLMCLDRDCIWKRLIHGPVLQCSYCPIIASWLLCCAMLYRERSVSSGLAFSPSLLSLFSFPLSIWFCLSPLSSPFRSHTSAFDFLWLCSFVLLMWSQSLF